jgi:Beta-lactamase enzyme family
VRPQRRSPRRGQADRAGGVADLASSLRKYLIGKRALKGIATGFGATFVVAIILTGAVAGLAALLGRSEPPDEPAAVAAAPRDGIVAASQQQRTARAPARTPGRHRRHQAAARDAAAKFAVGREGRVAFAEVGPDGAVRGRDEHELFQSASLVKSLILAAELQRLDRAGAPLDPTTRSVLERMITVSDNDAATEVFDRVGPEGVAAIGHRVGMDDLRTSATWGATQVSAADMALMFSDLDRILPRRFERFGKGLLGSISPDQSWGIPAAARSRGWSVRFKGGWRPDPGGQIVNQAAELDRKGTTIAIAVLTDGGPSMPYGIETVEGVASRLLGGD